MCPRGGTLNPPVGPRRSDWRLRRSRPGHVSGSAFVLIGRCQLDDASSLCVHRQTVLEEEHEKERKGVCVSVCVMGCLCVTVIIFKWLF